MTPTLHNYNLKAGKTYLWDTSDNQEVYEKNLANLENNKLLHELGFVDNPIEYKFNSHGFRTAEFDQKFDMVCFGCSFTMGTGVHAKHTWPEQLEGLTGLKIANLGHAGSSNDTAYRIARHYLHLLTPKYAVWLQTDMHRIEIIDESANTAINILAAEEKNLHADNVFVKTWMASEINQQINLEKNTQAFQQLCHKLSIIPIILSRHNIKKLDLARDLQHPGPRSYQHLAEKISLLVANQSIDQALIQ